MTIAPETALTRVARFAQRCADLRTPEAHLWARVVDMAREALPELVVSFSDPQSTPTKVQHDVVNPQA